jgi:hypothetical protein
LLHQVSKNPREFTSFNIDTTTLEPHIEEFIQTEGDPFAFYRIKQLVFSYNVVTSVSKVIVDTEEAVSRLSRGINKEDLLFITSSSIKLYKTNTQLVTTIHTLPALVRAI